MEITDSILAAGAIVAALTAIAVGVVKTWRAGSAAIKSAADIRDVLLGTDPDPGTITGRAVPAVPGIGERMTAVEVTLRTLADQHTVIADHETRIRALEDRDEA